MRILIVLLLFTMNVYADKSREGGGGKDLEIRKANIENKIVESLINIKQLFQLDPKAAQVFPEVPKERLIKTINDLITTKSIKIIADGDKENDDEKKTVIHDKYGIARTAVNYPSKGIIEYDLEKTEISTTNIVNFYILNMHEILGLLEIEKNDPKKSARENYSISTKLGPFLKADPNYTLDGSQVFSSIFEGQTCTLVAGSGPFQSFTINYKKDKTDKMPIESLSAVYTETCGWDEKEGPIESFRFSPAGPFSGTEDFTIKFYVGEWGDGEIHIGSDEDDTVTALVTFASDAKNNRGVYSCEDVNFLNIY